MSLVSWLGDFLEKRNCDDRKPDGRPLYAYRCTTDEFAEMQTLLTEAEKVVPNSSYHLGYALATDRLFTLYCAEWWRRSYQGGAWKWDPVKASLGWSYCDWHIATDFVWKGLLYWQRNLIRTGAGTQYLLSVASEGGIPINVLERDAAAFKGYLKAIIREYGYYAQSGLSAAQIAEENLFRLPISWRQPQIASLAGQIIEKVWYFKTEVGEVPDVVSALNATHPEWIEQFPLVLERSQAELLIRSLVEVAREAATGSSPFVRIERFLERGLDRWCLKARILMPKSLPFTHIAEASGLSTDALPERMEMYRLAAGSRILVAKLVKFTDSYSVRPVLGATHAFFEDVAKEQEVILVQRGNLLASISVVGGAALDSSLPWCFALADDTLQSYRFVAQGGCKRREPSVFVLCDQEPVSQADMGVWVGTCVDEQVLGHRFWRIDQVAIVQDDEGEQYKVEPALQKIAERDYRLVGHRRYFPLTRYPLYRSVPQVQWIEDMATGNIPSDELVWRPIGTSPWQSLERTRVFGDIEVRHRLDGVVLAAWRLSILPKVVGFGLEPVSRDEGKIHIQNLPEGSVRIVSRQGLEVSIEDTHDECLVTCRRNDVSLSEIQGKVQQDNTTALLFTIPFPAEGAAFVDSKGIEIDHHIELAQSRMFGIRAQTMSIDNRKKYRLRATILSSVNQLAAIRHHWFEYDMLKDESGLSTLSMQQINVEINRLFAIGTGVDDKVRLDLLETSRAAPAATVIVKQFEGTLSVDITGRIITLTVEPDLYPEYENSTLRLISINDFTSEPILLEWNKLRSGWSLPDFSEMNVSHTFFATLNGDQSQFIRPCVIPAEGATSLVDKTQLVRALLHSREDERINGIGEFFSKLEETNNQEDWRELCAALERFSSVHPDGLDLVECLIEHPKLFPMIWFYAVGDKQLKDYLQRIIDTSPFDWWMIRKEDWLASAKFWLVNEVAIIGNQEVRDMLIQQVKSELKLFVDENEELNTIGDLILEYLGEELPTDSVVQQARNMPPQLTWSLLDQLARGNWVNEIGDAEWPVIHDVFTLQRLLPEEIYHFIDWPVKDMGYQRSVMQAPIVAAAAMHANLEISRNHRIALMAARNFFPSAFATGFRATQAALWAYKEQQLHG